MSRTPFAGHISHTQIVSFRHAALDQFDRYDRLGFLLDEILEELLNLSGGNMAIV